jgi:hypothetical protein
MYGRTRRVHPAQFESTQFAPQAFYQPSPSFSFAPISYQHAPHYYSPAQAFDQVEQNPVTDLELLEYEEQQLIAQQQQILAQRRRIAEERHRIQQEAEQQERLRQYKLREAAIRRQQEQQRLLQIQERQRQLAAYKEAQLEAALRDLEYGSHRVASQPARATHQQQQQQRVVELNPVELLLQAFLPNGAQENRRARCQPPAASKPTAASSNKASCPFQAVPAFSTKAKPAQKPAAEKQQTEQAKSSSVGSLLKALTDRVIGVTKRVTDLLHTSFSDLSFRSFGNVDNELMQILLSLDNLSVDSEEAKAARKALVTKTMSLLDQVDEYKEAFSESTSSASSSSSSPSSATNSDDEDSEDEKDISEESAQVPITVLTEVSSALAYPKIDVPEEDIDADALSSSSDSEEEVKVAPKSAEIKSSAPVSNTVTDTPAAEEDLIDFEPSAPEAFEEEEKDSEEKPIEVVAPETSDDPFGFKAIEEVDRRVALANARASSDQVPIQINAAKTKVTIESSSSPVSSSE